MERRIAAALRNRKFYCLPEPNQPARADEVLRQDVLTQIMAHRSPEEIGRMIGQRQRL